MSHWLRFLRWYFTPIQALRALPNGDGAFAAFALSLALYERFIRCDLKYNQGVSASDEVFRKAAAADLDLTYDDFVCFWEIYHNGINHQGSPKKHKKGGVVYHWEISASHGERPVFRNEADGSKTVTIDPWKFWEYVFRKFEQQPDILQKSDTYAFGDIY